MITNWFINITCAQVLLRKSLLLPQRSYTPVWKVEKFLQLCTRRYVQESSKQQNLETTKMFINRRTHTLCYIHPQNITQLWKLMTYLYWISVTLRNITLSEISKTQKAVSSIPFFKFKNNRNHTIHCWGMYTYLIKLFLKKQGMTHTI